MEVDTKLRNTMLPLLTSDSNIIGIHGSFEAEETYTKYVFGSVAPGIIFLRNFSALSKTMLVSIGIWDKNVYTRSEIGWSPNFPFKVVDSWSNPRALRC